MAAFLRRRDATPHGINSGSKSVREPERSRAARVASGQLQQEEHMFRKYVTAGIVGSALMASAAFAQTPSATTTTTTTSPAGAPVSASDSSYNGNWRASKVVGLSVYNDNNESLGSINDLLTDKSGSIKAVVVGVGGFLGVGEHLVAVPYDKIKFVTEPMKVTTASTTGTSSTTATGMTTGAATTGAAPAPAAVTKPNPWYPDHAMLSATKDELKALPEFKYTTQ
jgi:sporulation protein YlmC with PRC-barrel domain